MPDFVHIQWPEAIYRWRHLLPHNDTSLRQINAKLDHFSSRKIPVVYTVHNLLPHGTSGTFESKVFQTIIKKSDIIVHHGEYSKNYIFKNFKTKQNVNHLVCCHGPYPIVKEDNLASRNALRLPSTKYVYLNFGIQKPYKGLDFCRQVFGRFKPDDIYFFTIGKFVSPKSIGAYKFWGYQLNARISSILKVDLMRNAKMIDRNVKQQEIGKIFAASDVVFLGHQDGLNSGILSLAASYSKPIVFPNLGNFKDHLRGWNWSEMYEAANVESAVESLDRMHRRILPNPPGNMCFPNHEWLKLNSWKVQVERITHAVEEMKRSAENKSM
jgi:hypothetical protein